MSSQIHINYDVCFTVCLSVRVDGEKAEISWGRFCGIRSTDYGIDTEIEDLMSEVAYLFGGECEDCRSWDDKDRYHFVFPSEEAALNFAKKLAEKIGHPTAVQEAEENLKLHYNISVPKYFFGSSQ